MYQIGEHIMYKNIGICVVEEIGKPGFLRIKPRILYAASAGCDGQRTDLCSCRF